MQRLRETILDWQAQDQASAERPLTNPVHLP
jgi:hypothetical protein